MSLATAPRSFAYTRPWMADYQTDAIFCPERYAVVEATTKSGKTAACNVWLTEQAMKGRAGCNYYWVSPIYAQAEAQGFERIKLGLPRDLYTATETKPKTITLANGTVIWFKGADSPDSLFGDDVYGAVLDEATRIKAEAWHAIRTTLTATRAPVRIIGNVKGRRNWAYLMARRAEAGEPNMHYAKITALDAVAAGILAADEVEDARRNLPDAVFRELYLAEPSDDGGNPFGLSAIQSCIGAIHSDCKPQHWGWDLAKSTDYTWGIGICEHDAVCVSDRFQLPWQETIDRIARHGSGMRALVDSTGVGDPILEQLQRRGSGHFEGFKFSQQSKQQLMEGLAVAIQQHQITYPAGLLVSELESFEYVYTRTGVHYSAPEGLHDDGVCSLGMAVMAHRRPRLPMFI